MIFFFCLWNPNFYTFSSTWLIFFTCLLSHWPAYLHLLIYFESWEKHVLNLDLFAKVTTYHPCSWSTCVWNGRSHQALITLYWCHLCFLSLIIFCNLILHTHSQMSSNNSLIKRITERSSKSHADALTYWSRLFITANTEKLGQHVLGKNW